MRLEQSTKELLTEAAARYALALPGSPAAYYLAERGISEAAAAVHQLGYVTNENFAPSHSGYVGMLSIPYMTVTGVTAFKFRKLKNDGSAKYLSPAGERLGVYNVTTLLHYQDYVAICEGELDTVSVASTGIPAVGIPGVGHWKPHYARLFDGIPRIFIIADNDSKEGGGNPGQDFARKLCQELPTALNVMLPAGMDANSFLLEKGEGELFALLGIG